MTNQDYKNAALAALKGKWAPAVLTSAVLLLLMLPYMAVAEYPVITGVSTTVSLPSWYLPATFGGLVYLLLLVLPVEEIGFPNACRILLETGDDRILGNSFSIGFNRWLRNIWAYILLELKVFLWMLLLIVPGIVKAFGYALTPYLLAEHPELSALQCIKLSDKMMKGHKFDLFYLYLSFIGWLLLCILTLGIGLLWLIPYMQTATASFYQDIKSQHEAGLLSESSNQTN